MNDATAIALNALNQTFYSESAALFSATRTAPWPGWRSLLPLLLGRSTVSILDVGCGNGRFGRYLRTSLGTPFLYCGIDASAPLLAEAERALADLPAARLLHADLVLDPVDQGLPDEDFDCVVAFGLLHHIPMESRRRALIHTLASRVAPGGILALTFWDFAREPRFAAKRVHDLPPELEGQLEVGDALLRFGDAASPRLRYCHFVDAEEEERLLAGLPLVPLQSFASDGGNERLNRYRVFARS